MTSPRAHLRLVGDGPAIGPDRLRADMRRALEAGTKPILTLRALGRHDRAVELTRKQEALHKLYREILADE